MRRSLVQMINTLWFLCSLSLGLLTCTDTLCGLSGVFISVFQRIFFLSAETNSDLVRFSAICLQSAWCVRPLDSTCYWWYTPYTGVCVLWITRSELISFNTPELHLSSSSWFLMKLIGENDGKKSSVWKVILSAHTLTIQGRWKNSLSLPPFVQREVKEHFYDRGKVMIQDLTLRRSFHRGQKCPLPKKTAIKTLQRNILSA